MPETAVDVVAKAIAEALAEAYCNREEPTDEDHKRAASAAIMAYNDYMDRHV